MDKPTLAAFAVNPLIGPRRFAAVRGAFPDPAGFLDLSVKDQMAFLRLDPDHLSHRKIFETMRRNAENALRTCEKKSIRLISADEPEYPARLRTIPDAPFALFVLGRPELPSRTVAVVGTRRATPDAASVTEYFSRVFAEHGAGVVSGMALGHDGISQNTALECGGYTAAVLGTGIDVVFPPEYERLYRRIAETGAVFSEYGPGARGLPFQFSLRNRIISGLSDAVLVVQAPEKSGALITARYAAAQGRDVYAVPGNPTDPLNAGTNRLIQEGAKMALRPEDILRDLPAVPAGAEATPAVHRHIPSPATAKTAVADLDEDEKKILSFLQTEKYIDDLARDSDLELPRLTHLLTRMELKGAVRQFPGRIYARE